MNQSTTTTGNKIKYKIVLLGDQHVGKSCIIQRYIHNKFDRNTSPTVGIDFLAKNLAFKNRTYRLQLWDTAGQERFRSLIPSYLKDAICSIIVYDVSQRVTLQHVEEWMKLFNNNKLGEGYTILVGNKIDLPNRQVSTEQGKKVAQALKIDYWELSAKTGQNIQDLFVHLVDMLSQGKSNCNNIAETIPVQQPVTTTFQKMRPEVAQSYSGAVAEKMVLVDETGQVIREHDTIVKVPSLYAPPQNAMRLPVYQSQVYSTPAGVILPPPVTQTVLVSPILPIQNNGITLSNPTQQPSPSTKKRCCSST